ncbi:hypothetical protein [Oceanithermus profundus]|nr:hypothetical protein [Oceanithermus profundus]
MARIKAVASWLVGLAGALVLSGLLAYLVYGVLLRFGLEPDRAASFAAPTWPGFVVALFTVALWRSTQAQAEATRAMQELQARMAAADLAPLLGVRVVKEFDDALGRQSSWIEVSNLGKYGVLLLSAYFLESCTTKVPTRKPLEELGRRSDFPAAIPSGATVRILRLDPVDGVLKEGQTEELGCLVLSLLYGSEDLVRCYDATRVVDAVIRIVYERPDSREHVSLFEPPKDFPYEKARYGEVEETIVVPATVLKERPCPRWVARALDAAEGA